MGIARGPNVINDGLVFGYDTGHPISDNTVSNRFNQGEPTVNYVTDASLLENGWSGSYSLIESATKSFQFNVSNFNGSAGSGQGWRSFMWDMRSHAGSAVTISATIEVPSDSPGNFAWVMMGQAHSGSGGTTTATYLGYSATSERYYKSTTNTERITWSGTIGNTGTANQPNGIIGFTVWYNGGTSGTNHFIKVSNVQIEKIAHETPFINGTRSDTVSLIDLKRTTSIDVGDVSFDSNAQPDFDGTDDLINITNYTHHQRSTGTIEAVVKLNTISGNRYIFGAGGTTTYGASRALRVLNGYWGTVTYGSSNHDWGTGVAASTTDWQHVAFGWNGTTVYFYINGVRSSITRSGLVTPLGTTLRIGMPPWTTGSASDGQIALIKHYSTVLTESEIQQNYKAYKNRFNI